MINSDTEAEIQAAETDIANDELVRWEAYEHPPVQRPAGWYIAVALLAVVFMALAIFLIRSWSFALVIAAAAAALVVYAKRPPSTISYTLSSKGIYVDDILKNLEQYKAFGVRKDEDLSMFTLVLLPTKRFMPGLTAYFPEESGEEIVDFLAARLPMQEIKPDAVDQLIKKLRL